MSLLILHFQSHVLCFSLLFNAMSATDFIEIEVSVHWILSKKKMLPCTEDS